MKSEKNILVAFILNLAFAIFEFFGGLFTNSIAILSDALHDAGDSLSIGISYFLERKSRKEPNKKYTFGYVRYSVIGSLITTTILIIGSLFVIYSALKRLINPVSVNYNGMIIFAVFGVIVNLCAAHFTKNGESLNLKSVNLHMIEDVLGWVIVLIGSIIMKFVDISLIDSILSIGVALFILINAFKGLMLIVDLFLEKTPDGINIDLIVEDLKKIKGISNVHHIHVWSIDGYNNYATLHVVSKSCNKKIKEEIRANLKEHGIGHVTIEFDKSLKECNDEVCEIHDIHDSHCHHNH